VKWILVNPMRQVYGVSPVESTKVFSQILKKELISTGKVMNNPVRSGRPRWMDLDK